MTRRRRTALGIGIVALGAIVLIGWFLISPLFIDEVVDEAFPTPEEMAAMTGDEREELREPVMEAARNAPDKAMTEDMPGAEDSGSAQLATGAFKDADSIHKGSGTATLYRLADGRHVVRLESFEVTNGPDLRVLASAHPDPTNGDEVHQGYRDLGALKGNVGSQNYELPADADAASFHSVIIYCRTFSVIFSVAALGPA